VAWVAVGLALLISCAAVVVIHRERAALLFKTTFRIGFNNSAKEHFPGPDGKPMGNTVDLLNEAARRSGIQLEWVYSPEGPDTALETGQVDLWPTIGDLPERAGRVYISDPWSMISYGLVSRTSDPITSGSESSGITVSSYTGNNVEAKLAKRKFPNAKFVYVDGVEGQLSAVCGGHAQAAIIPQNFVQFAMPEECQNVSLQMLDAPGFSIRFGIGASYRRPGAVEAAKALRDQMGVMAKDSSLVGTEFRWMDTSFPQEIVPGLVESNGSRLLARYATCAC
jgi:ABC-type amino acid transport substrate-binding protein